jgi:hypothetical protein
VPLLQGISTMRANEGERGLAEQRAQDREAAELVKTTGGKERILLDRVVGPPAL